MENDIITFDIIKTKSPKDLAPLIKKWMADFKKLDLSELSQRTIEVLNAKYKIAQRMANMLKQGATMPDLENFPTQRKAESQEHTRVKLHVWDALSEISDVELRNNMMQEIFVSKPDTIQPYPADVAVFFSPEPIPLKSKRKNTQRPTDNNSYENINNVDSRKRVLREMDSEANADQRNSSTNTQSVDHTSVQTAVSLSGDDDGYTVIGPNGTKVPTEKFQDIPFLIPCKATSTLISLVFSEEVLATNTFSGRPSPAFVGRERPLKGQLDPQKIADIIHCITTRTTYCDKDVRLALTLKCSIISTKMKKRLSKSASRAN